MNNMIGYPAQRLKISQWLIIASILGIYLVNNLFSVINLENETWDRPYLFPYIKPIGTDFRIGMFYPAMVLLEGQSPYEHYNLIYPPFTAVFSIPFRLFDIKTAYILQVILLYMANIATIYIAARSAASGLDQDQEPSLLNPALNVVFLSIVFLTLNSYGFLFSLERGNFDIYAQFFSVLGLWLLLKRPDRRDRLWLQVVLISLAAHLKVYPAILFFLVLWRHGWKSLLPLFTVNLALLLCTGPVYAWQFVQTIVQYTQEPFIWIGNHSGASFADFVNSYLAARLGFTLPGLLFTAVPLLVWAVGTFELWRRERTPANALLFFCLSVPVMNLVPTVSHDYKLVILSAPLTIILYWLVKSYTETGKPVELAKMAAFMFLALFLTRLFSITPPVLMNKYPFILMMEGLIALMILFPGRLEKDAQAQRSNETALHTTPDISTPG